MEGLNGFDVAILVEGESDRAALVTLAERLGVDPAARGAVIVPMGGATNISRFVSRLGPRGAGARLVGLCDAGEERHFDRAFAQAGLGRDFHVCVADLEDELIRALGVAGVERVIAGQGRERSLWTYRRQPAHRSRPADRQLHGFMSNEKERYARAMARALDPDRVPEPLAAILTAM
ncbi:ATP-dependent endonuclease [Nocardiopsis sp. N85]|uniref:TOPRIM nucleotidyl transferase/hydrolase domain-containing protein n=1 Tax=Nocardiopsis sp. N85 TaxID=3029400 RepID=UPI00237F7E94|nr:TOPRIM nucleotidyl transferase/hydrolase domain-containing protein [Nocardiopsis sp. N85]MDE3720388.1 ATP-dependent endonuclease [Nocardiopsis sp. N85]